MTRAALVYDFDGTLARGNIQERTFLPELGIENPAEFWDEVRSEARRHDADEILVYMWRMLERARARNVAIDEPTLMRHGAKADLFDGVSSWFERINRYATDLGLEVEHYLVSSGTREMIAGCPIQRHFKIIYASHFIYDADGRAVWPGLAINYTTKTQFLFRINKGIANSWDREAINRWMPVNERPIPFQRMVFIGDGETDIPSMKMVRQLGGQSIGVFDPRRFGELQETVSRLIAEDRVSFVAPANYADGSQLDVTVKGILRRFATDAGLGP
jgi:hypothetical protein